MASDDDGYIDYIEIEPPPPPERERSEPARTRNRQLDVVIALLLLTLVGVVFCAYQLWRANDLTRKQECASTMYWFGTKISDARTTEQLQTINRQFDCGIK